MWCCGVYEIERLGFIHTFAECANKCERNNTRAFRLERGRCSDFRVANTLGGLRIMIPYCIQIRIYTNTNTCIYGHRHEDSFVPWKCTTGAAWTHTTYLKFAQHVAWENKPRCSMTVEHGKAVSGWEQQPEQLSRTRLSSNGGIVCSYIQFSRNSFLVLDCHRAAGCSQTTCCASLFNKNVWEE